MRAPVTIILLLGACAPAEQHEARDAKGREERWRDAATRVSCDVVASKPWQPAPVGAARFVVNRGTRGMSSDIRWVLSPDSGVLVVIDDPVSVEADPVPDAVLHASERTGRVWRMDSVWTASPSPDFARVAVGRAVFLRGDASDRVAPARWEGAASALARIAGPDPALRADSLRAYAFSASGMGVAEGAAATFVADLSAGLAEPPMRFASLGGWRVRWSCDGADLLVGERPARDGTDDAPATPERRVALGRAPGAAPADSVRWMAGPTLVVGDTSRHAGATSLVARGRTVEVRGGRITVRDGATGATRDVGPGMPLAVTRGGRFILALAPRQPARPGEAYDEAVVYRVP